MRPRTGRYPVSGESRWPRRSNASRLGLPATSTDGGSRSSDGQPSNTGRRSKARVFRMCTMRRPASGAERNVVSAVATVSPSMGRVSGRRVSLREQLVTALTAMTSKSILSINCGVVTSTKPKPRSLSGVDRRRHPKLLLDHPVHRQPEA